MAQQVKLDFSGTRKQFDILVGQFMRDLACMISRWREKNGERRTYDEQVTREEQKIYRGLLEREFPFLAIRNTRF